MSRCRKNQQFCKWVRSLSSSLGQRCLRKHEIGSHEETLVPRPGVRKFFLQRLNFERSRSCMVFNEKSQKLAVMIDRIACFAVSSCAEVEMACRFCGTVKMKKNCPCCSHNYVLVVSSPCYLIKYLTTHKRNKTTPCWTPKGLKIAPRFQSQRAKSSMPRTLFARAQTVFHAVKAEPTWALNSRREAGLCSLIPSVTPADLKVDGLSLHLDADLPGSRDFQVDTLQSSLIPDSSHWHQSQPLT